MQADDIHLALMAQACPWPQPMLAFTDHWSPMCHQVVRVGRWWVATDGIALAWAPASTDVDMPGGVANLPPPINDAGGKYPDCRDVINAAEAAWPTTMRSLPIIAMVPTSWWVGCKDCQGRGYPDADEAGSLALCIPCDSCGGRGHVLQGIARIDGRMHLHGMQYLRLHRHFAEVGPLTYNASGKITEAVAFQCQGFRGLVSLYVVKDHRRAKRYMADVTTEDARR